MHLPRTSDPARLNDPESIGGGTDLRITGTGRDVILYTFTGA